LGLKFASVHSTNHNFAWLNESGNFVHRKGAIQAADGQLGLIPGSSGMPSYIVRGKGNEQSLQSASHGAGRPRSRSASKKLHDPALFELYMQEKDITYHGVAADETWMAYKNIEEVMAAQVDLVVPVSKMIPKVVVMGGHVQSDDGD
jgi:tRNA-splicing ligase RtcB